MHRCVCKSPGGKPESLSVQVRRDALLCASSVTFARCRVDAADGSPPSLKVTRPSEICCRRRRCFLFTAPSFRLCWISICCQVFALVNLLRESPTTRRAYSLASAQVPLDGGKNLEKAARMPSSSFLTSHFC